MWGIGRLVRLLKPISANFILRRLLSSCQKPAEIDPYAKLKILKECVVYALKRKCSSPEKLKISQGSRKIA